MSTYCGVNARLAYCLNSVLNVNQEKAIVGAFTVIVQLHRLIVCSTKTHSPNVFFSVNTFDGPITLRTRSRGLGTNILVLKTWIFGHKGATVVNINVLIMDFLLYPANVVCIKHFIISEMLSRTKSWRYYPNSLWREFTKKTFLNRSFVLYWILSWKVCVNCK